MTSCWPALTTDGLQLALDTNRFGLLLAVCCAKKTLPWQRSCCQRSWVTAACVERAEAGLEETQIAGPPALLGDCYIPGNLPHSPTFSHACPFSVD